jgi:hypothetical protein
MSRNSSTSALVAASFLAAIAAAAFAAAPAVARDQAPAAPDLVRPAAALMPCPQRYRPFWSPALNDVSELAGEAAAKLIEDAFDARLAYGVAENIVIEQGVLTVHYPEGSINPSNDDAPLGGAGFYAALPAGLDAACLSYAVRFDADMAFVRGGKLPGLFGGEAPSGGEEVTGTNGFSVRLMWRQDGAGELYEYIVNKGDADSGLSVGRGLFHFDRDRWVRLDLEVVLNTPGAADGIARLWVDGRAVIDQSEVIYRTDRSVTIDGLMFSTFFGGSTPKWASPRDQMVRFKDFMIFTLEDPAPGH